mmetsp:Transcript_13745/g.29873  ORF Transcript_13745/g.29873 Transcript_13745/m.29873 type:complete len:370 (-) Transcript_13745:146-1255(-)|eukprot:CAMPEP_0172548166 /NCGR_PEP_ID=MMETSP1067-20121228/17535_1 /TAXON_ID=265564 ORGANISM="Thalassiosira punctigera, Strain Tpunct2005C2" /NCGR_SAMPLE_ID=MMETSP1067 /ASSEMBLY_ACC=CAM_ASM_000444 /LENGTH=369 /DNA_ID=CAMNT_0013335361 /DNA_START=137 /DNA_END=1246 /DNA_ORIENTATION=+
MTHQKFFPLKLKILSSVGLFCVIASIFNLHTDNSFRGRRVLSALDPFLDSNAIPPWAQNNLIDVNEPPNPSEETALFWHIPKSGGTTAKRLYECLGQTLANRLGADPRFGHHNDEEIVIFHPFATAPEIKFVNVDTTTKAGILRAEKLGLVPSKKVDMIFTSDINFAADHLFDSNHRGRILAFFRNPVDRSVSKFYYLQTATWERTYRPEWAGMEIVEWATHHNLDENFVVKKILGKKLSEPVDIGDLVLAKEIVRRRFIVGLMNDMEESIRRFNIILGLSYADEKGQSCREEYFGTSTKKEASAVVDIGDGNTKAKNDMNSNPHPKVKEGSPEYNLIAERNALDMILYNYITLLYSEQKGLIDSYAST